MLPGTRKHRCIRRRFQQGDHYWTKCRRGICVSSANHRPSHKRYNVFSRKSTKIDFTGFNLARIFLLQLCVFAGLFSGVIGHSGSALEFWAIDKKPLESAWKFATEFCKCPAATNSSEIYGCLSALPVETIVLCTHDMVVSIYETFCTG